MWWIIFYPLAFLCGMIAYHFMYHHFMRNIFFWLSYGFSKDFIGRQFDRDIPFRTNMTGFLIVCYTSLIAYGIDYKSMAHEMEQVWIRGELKEYYLEHQAQEKRAQEFVASKYQPK